MDPVLSSRLLKGQEALQFLEGLVVYWSVQPAGTLDLYIAPVLLAKSWDLPKKNIVNRQIGQLNP